MLSSLRQVAVAAYPEPLPTDTVERPLLRASLLVRREAEPRFLDEVERLRARWPEPVYRLLLTGPWPPYRFGGLRPRARRMADELPILGGSSADEMSLLELADRLLNRGVVLTGEATISVAGVDLIYLGLNVVLTAVENLKRQPERGSGARALHSRSERRPRHSMQGLLLHALDDG